VIEKSYVGNTGGTAVNGTGIAKVGDTLTYTLAYDLTNGPVHNAVITDTLPNGLAYVVGSATNSLNGQFTFVSYDAATRKLTWTAAVASSDSSVSYKVTVLDGSFNLPQPLVNTATIDSDETNLDDDTANVLVQVVLAATATPVATLPPTDTIDSGDQAPSNPGFGLMLALLVLAGFGLVLGYLTPTPARARREEVRRR
jgi:fimbrial isopeptide formation D2 family protein